MVHLPSVTLSDEERQECAVLMSTLLPRDGEGSWFIKDELLEPFKQMVAATCLIARANRFAIMKRIPEACQSGEKACTFYPLSITFYDYACVLKLVGLQRNSKMMFAEFIRRSGLAPQNEIDRNALADRDIQEMVRHATEEVNGDSS